MAFRRPPSAFRNQLGSQEFPFEADRYILYVCLACPWANGVLQMARLKGLSGSLAEIRAFNNGELNIPLILNVTVYVKYRIRNSYHIECEFQ
jgi:hypothetical protein